MSSIQKLEEKKQDLLDLIEEVDLDNRHERHRLHRIIHDLEEGLHRFEEEQLEDLST